MIVSHVPLAERRARLQRAVAYLAEALQAGGSEISIVELQALADICDSHNLHVEAARIRRWLQVPVGNPLTAIEGRS